ncbi:MAG: PCP reductase family protein [Candidatus Poribacteria bacterium]|nr:PCP reductase family protein [Candidatus Poribacteria bacterium]
MKFLCIDCDTAMKFKDVTRPEQGSVTAVFECPDCFTEIAMYLNPSETQMLKSMDLKLGGNSEAAQPMQMVRSQLETAKQDSMSNTISETGSEETVEGGKCPFTGVISDAFEEKSEPEPDGLTWTPEALERLERIPSFVRPMAKMGIESFAKKNGHTEITGEIMDAARGNFPAQF